MKAISYDSINESVKNTLVFLILCSGVIFRKSNFKANYDYNYDPPPYLEGLWEMVYEFLFSIIRFLSIFFAIFLLFSIFPIFRYLFRFFPFFFWFYRILRIFFEWITPRPNYKRFFVHFVPILFNFLYELRKNPPFAHYFDL